MQESDRELLIRLDERVRNAVTTMEQRDIYHRAEMDRLTKLMTDQMATFTTAVTTIAANFASKADLTAVTSNITRVERIVYGFCAAILLAVIGALMTGILGGKP
jgi:RNA polymerase-binding transcription factor DksA